MEIKMSKSKKKPKWKIDFQNDKDIERACRIEQCQSALFKTLMDLVQEHGREIVGESLEWFQNKLKVKENE